MFVGAGLKRKRKGRKIKGGMIRAGGSGGGGGAPVRPRNVGIAAPVINEHNYARPIHRAPVRAVPRAERRGGAGAGGGDGGPPDGGGGRATAVVLPRPTNARRLNAVIRKLRQWQRRFGLQENVYLDEALDILNNIQNGVQHGQPITEMVRHVWPRVSGLVNNGIAGVGGTIGAYAGYKKLRSFLGYDDDEEKSTAPKATPAPPQAAPPHPTHGTTAPPTHTAAPAHTAPNNQRLDRHDDTETAAPAAPAAGGHGSKGRRSNEGRNFLVDRGRGLFVGRGLALRNSGRGGVAGRVDKRSRFRNSVQSRHQKSHGGFLLPLIAGILGPTLAGIASTGISHALNKKK